MFWLLQLARILPWRFPNSLIVVVILYDIVYTFASMYSSIVWHSFWLWYQLPIVLGNDMVPNIKLVVKEKKSYGSYDNHIEKHFV